MLTRRRPLLVSAPVAALPPPPSGSLLPEEDAATGFPMIRYGKESCMFCGMTIGDERSAAWRPAPGATSTSTTSAAW
jgi:hypothetical protein